MLEIAMYVLVFVVLGTVLHFADVKYGEGLYRYLWGKVHRDPLPKGEVRGFVAGRTTRERVVPALIVVALAFFLLRILGEHDFIILVLKCLLLMVPGLLIGFMVGGILKKNSAVAERADAVFSKLDEFERKGVDVEGIAGKVATTAEDLGKKAAAAATSAGKQFADAVTGTHEAPAADVAKPEASPAPVAPPEPERKKPVSVAEAARNFSHRT